MEDCVEDIEELYKDNTALLIGFNPSEYTAGLQPGVYRITFELSTDKFVNT